MPHKDPEARKAYRRVYYAKNKAKIRAAQKKWLVQPANRTKQAEWERKYRSRHPDRIRTQWITQRERRYKTSGRPKPEACDICGSTTGRIVFDHCHKHGHFRGWICHRCNVVLGQVEDDAGLLIKLIAYLRRTLVNTSPQLSLPGV